MPDATGDHTDGPRPDDGADPVARARPGPSRPAPDVRSRGWRAGDALVGLLARAGVGPIHLLTVVGRRTGRPHTHPMVPVDHAGSRWLVAPYGAVAWVHNARAAGRVSLRHGRTTRHYTVREVAADEAGPVLKRYVRVATATRPHFTATVDSPVADFVAEADRHPVFELTPIAEGAPRPDRGPGSR